MFSPMLSDIESCFTGPVCTLQKLPGLGIGIRNFPSPKRCLVCSHMCFWPQFEIKLYRTDLMSSTSSSRLQVIQIYMKGTYLCKQIQIQSILNCTDPLRIQNGPNHWPWQLHFSTAGNILTPLVDPWLSYLDTKDVSSVDDEFVGQLGVVGQVVFKLLRVADVACAKEFFYQRITSGTDITVQYRIRVRVFPSTY